MACGASEEKLPWVEMALNPASAIYSGASIFTSVSLHLPGFPFLHLRAFGRMNRKIMYKRQWTSCPAQSVFHRCKFRFSLVFPLTATLEVNRFGVLLFSHSFGPSFLRHIEHLLSARIRAWHRGYGRKMVDAKAAFLKLCLKRERNIETGSCHLLGA